MTDVFSKKKRSDIMRAVKASETKPEILVRKFLFSLGFRYRKNYASLSGKPDIVLPKYKTIIFVHGCFWHGHKGCKAADLPKSNKAYWSCKIGRNVERDQSNIYELRQAGWKVLIIWECQIKQVLTIKNLGRDKFLRFITNISRSRKA